MSKKGQTIFFAVLFFWGDNRNFRIRCRNPLRHLLYRCVCTIDYSVLIAQPWWVKSEQFFQPPPVSACDLHSTNQRRPFRTAEPLWSRGPVTYISRAAIRLGSERRGYYVTGGGGARREGATIWVIIPSREKSRWKENELWRHLVCLGLEQRSVTSLFIFI